jgi:hypothetical protein
MIRVSETNEGLTFAGSLPRGLVAYIDAEWVRPEATERIPAILVPADGDSDTAALHALASIADAAARAAASWPVRAEGPTEVWGRGAVALAAGRALGVQARDRALRGERPAAVVETTGDPDRINEATRVLADLGTLVLVGEALGRHLSLNLYADVHSRGLRIVGIPTARTLHDQRDGPAPHGVDVLLESLAKVQFGTPLPDSAAWFRLSEPGGADIVKS